MKDLVDEALARWHGEYEETRPRMDLVCIDGLGGNKIVCCADDIIQVSEAQARDARVSSGEWISVPDRFVIDVQEVA